MSTTTLKKSAPERNTGADCPNKDTDKFYEIEQEAFFAAQSRIINALVESGEKHNLCMEDINALARFLAYAQDTGDYGQFAAVVDFLWMSYHIENHHKMLLLDLAVESEYVR